ncbi:MAG TPA: transposase family protein [Thermoanaerobaculia bacterium]|nr:transposase family protein [Thermoanaerobaculia bacterium]
MARRDNMPQSYEPAPQVPKEMLERFQTIQEVLAGALSMTEGARRLSMSRNHFQTLVHRAERAMLQAMTPKPAGRPATPAKEIELRKELTKLQRENEQLKARGDAVERLLDLAGDWARGRIGMRARRAKAQKAKAPSNDPEEPDGGIVKDLWMEACRQVSRGAKWHEAARMLGRSSSTLRRWKRRACCRCLLRQRPGPGSRGLPSLEQCSRAEDLVRALDGQIGAAALSKSVSGLSRRDASRLKHETLTRMEAERKAATAHIIVKQTDVIRGFDPVYAAAAEGRRYLMPVSDAAVPKRTTVDLKERYNAETVYDVLRKDIEKHGPPLVYRMDRARQHDHPRIRALLAEHRVLVLHGPPHYPCYYGQLERQNREHRALLRAMGPVPTEVMASRASAKIAAIDNLWPRRALGWRTSQQVWQTRPPLLVDRDELRREVQSMAERLQRKMRCRGFPADMAERLAIEAALTRRGLLSRTGGRR